MTQDPIVTDEIKKLIGDESEPAIYEIEKEPIRRWAQAIGDTNPLYHDEEYARKSGYRSLVAPPVFMASYLFPVKAGKQVARPVGRTTKWLSAGNDYEFFKVIQAGDTIIATTKLIDIYERDGNMGRMMFVTNETIFRNQSGEIVAKTRSRRVLY